MIQIKIKLITGNTLFSGLQLSVSDLRFWYSSFQLILKQMLWYTGVV